MRTDGDSWDVVWFKRDLRVEDHAALAQACARAQGGRLIALYIAEPEMWAQPDMSGRQWDFTAETLRGLREDLRARGGDLVVRIGDVVTLLRALHRRHPIARLWSHEETGNGWTYRRDLAVKAFCRQAGIDWREARQFGVLRGLRDRDRWAGAWERLMRAPQVAAPVRLPPLPDGMEPGPIPTAAQLGLPPDPCPGRQRGGRGEALSLLDSFFAGRGVEYRREMSSPLTAADACSRLSPHLAVGSLSMREVVQRARAERNAGWLPTGAVDSLLSRLHWHCHFIQKLESEPEMECRALHRLHEASGPDAGAPARLEAWATGATGFPFVDACMKSLIATGWINFRMRAMLMAFASYHLALDWRQSGTRLARLFTDYEPGIHWPQVQMQSGVTGINTPRIYNPVKQSLDQDPQGIFIRRHLPVLASLPDAFIHEPWRMDEATQARLGVVIGRDYPAPIVDHEAAARAARERIAAIRRHPQFRALALDVFERHGSRARRLDDDDPPKRAADGQAKAARAARQLTLDL